MTETVRPINGWAAWKGRSIYDASLSPTKRDMLIGYDLMPLRGLRKTEAHLRRHGITIERTKVFPCSASRRHGFALVRNGVILTGSLSWSITHKGGGVWKVENQKGDWALSHNSACGFVNSEFEDELSTQERSALHLLWHGEHDKTDPYEPRDKRRRKTFENARCVASEVWQRLGIKMIPVRFARANAQPKERP